MSVIKKIIDYPEKILYGLEKKGFFDKMSDEQYIKLVYRWAFRRPIHLDNPKAFTEKINWYKLNYRDPLMKICADKYEVRAYVEKILGEGTPYLNECYGIWKSADEIDFNSLPNEFVLKPTNGSGDVFLCPDKSKLDKEQAIRTLTTYSSRHFSSKTREWAYYDLPYRIIAERLIHSSDANQIKDYKFFCFYGEPQFLFAATERGTEHLKFDFFDMDWKWLPVTNEHEHNPKLPRPEHFEEMKELCRKLSRDFPHVRVDLYEEEGRVFFGELTFYHFGGFTRFRPDEWDFKFGEYFDLSKIDDFRRANNG